MDALYRSARELTAKATVDLERAAEEERAAHVAAVRDAQAKLMGGLLDTFRERVEEAARAGKREVDLLTFYGPETFEGNFFYLYLVRGPRTPEEGVEPLLGRLQKELAPFAVRHEWNQGTVFNRVIASWA